MANFNENLKKSEDAMKDIKDQAVNAGDKIKDKAENVASKAMEKGGEIVDTVRDKASNASQQVTELVKSNPYIAIASALVTGWLIAKIL
ncbi:MAG: hypothetical protein K0R49_1626 [Burkholderiales bacterium]|jgi:ElaB/YqjD/DUF883 family membrane-anchored ribosome-binding protein|nr:hypothetical protein [Burkholderiales bacterium]